MATATLHKKQSAKRTELFENVAAAPLRIDRASGVIRGVKVLGRVSRNNREYTTRAMDQAAVLYEGIKLYLDHDRKSCERGVGEFFGELRNVRVGSDGVFADLHYLKSHALVEAVLERAEKFPGSFGLSPHQFGPTRMQGRKQIVEGIVDVRSVDLVQLPATNKSLFESEEGNPQSPADKLMAIERSMEEAVSQLMSVISPTAARTDTSRAMRHIEAVSKKLQELLGAMEKARVDLIDSTTGEMKAKPLRKQSKPAAPAAKKQAMVESHRPRQPAEKIDFASLRDDTYGLNAANRFVGISRPQRVVDDAELTEDEPSDHDRFIKSIKR